MQHLSISRTDSCKTAKLSDGEAYASGEVLRSKQKVFFVKLCLRVVLVVSIIMIWVSLFSPLIVGYFARPSSENITTPYHDLLNHSKIVCNDSNANLTLNGSRPLCPEKYVFKCPMCLPICGVWHPFGDSYFKAYRSIAIVVSVVDFIFATFGFIIFVRVPGSLRFPKIIYLFIFLSLIYLSVPFVIISIMGPHSFFCALRNEDQETVAASPSAMVTVVGALVHYSLISFDFCFFVAALNIFILIFFPHWQIMDSVKKKRGLLIGEFIFCVCIPLIFPFGQLAIHQKYSFAGLPLLPFPYGENFTPVALIFGPLWLMTGAALTLIALSIYRVQIMKYLIYKTIIKFKSYEVRHILFAIQVGFTVSFIFVDLAVQSTNNVVVDILLQDFWACITLQNNPQFLANPSLVPSHCPTTYKAYYHPILTMLGYLTNGISAVEIVVILTTKETYETWGSSFRRVFNSINTKASSIAITTFKKS